MTMTAAQLRAARALINITQEELAARAGVAAKTIVSFEAEGRVPREATLVKLRAALESDGVVFVESDAGLGIFLSRDGNHRR